MQFQTVSDHRNCIFSNLLIEFSRGFSSDYYHIPFLIVNPVRGNLRGKTTNNEPSKGPMQPSCPQDNKIFTAFAEPCGIYFTYFHLLMWEYAGLNLKLFWVIIGCLHNVPYHMGKQIFSPRLYRFHIGWPCK